MEWVRKRSKTADFTELYHTMLNGDADHFEKCIKDYLRRSISFYDEKETFYHGFMIGIMSNLEGYRILSNRETGDGRADLIMKPIDEQKPAIIFELKYSSDSLKFEERCNEAIRQIEEHHYADELLEEGYYNIFKYRICFCKKNCRVKCDKKCK